MVKLETHQSPKKGQMFSAFPAYNCQVKDWYKGWAASGLEGRGDAQTLQHPGMR